MMHIPFRLSVMRLDGSAHMVRIPLAQLQDRWEQLGFIRIHRSFLVSINQITSLKLGGSGYRVTIGVGDDEVKLPVNRRHLRNLKDRLERRSERTG